MIDMPRRRRQASSPRQYNEQRSLGAGRREAFRDLSPSFLFAQPPRKPVDRRITNSEATRVARAVVNAQGKRKSFAKW